MPLLPIDEEPLDRFVNRPLARLAAAALAPTPVTANQVSIFAGLLGVGAGAAMCVGTPAWLVAAAFLLWGQLVFDCADGELARRRGGGGWVGQVVDGIADYAVAVAIHVGLWAMLARTPGYRSWPWWWMGLFVAATGFSMALHSGIFDAAKQNYRLTLGKASPWFVDPPGMCEAARTGWGRVLGFFFRMYAGQQRALAAWSRVESQAAFFAWCILGPTVRVVVLAAAVLAAIRVPTAIAIYPLFGLGICNLLLVLLVVGARLGRAAATARPS